MTDDVSMIVDQLRRSAPGGIGTYTRGLLKGLRAMGPDAPPVTLIAGRGPRPDPVTDLGFALRSSPLPSRVLTRLWDHGVTGMPRPRGAVLQATSLSTPYPRGLPVVVTVHDVAWRVVPETFPAQGRAWHERALRRCLDHAAAIVVPAPHTAAALGDDKRIVVIPEGADHLPPPDDDGAASLLRHLGVTGPYLLSVSTIEPRKNLRRVIDAFLRAQSHFPEPWPLVVAGPEGWGADLKATEAVKLAGLVHDPVLAALYRRARCLVYVPLFEGWGLPPAEAMHAGVPVVASPMPSTGGAALEVDPHDTDGIAAAMVVAATDEGRRADLIAAGTRRADDLTWEAVARQHVAVWSQVAR